MNTLTTHHATVYTPTAAAATTVRTALLHDNAMPDPWTSTSAGSNVASLTARDATPTRFRVRHVAAILMLASLVACGSMPGERAISGAGIGAGAGAAVGAVTGMGVGTGAAIGAAAGAAAGGLTKEKDVNLGKPVWK